MGNTPVLFHGALHKAEQVQQGDRKKIGFESAANVREKKIVSEDSIKDMFEELRDT